MKRIIYCLLLVPVLLITFVNSAYAYLDPGPMSLLIQIVIGAVAAVLFAVKTYWHKVKRFFSRMKKSDRC